MQVRYSEGCHLYADKIQGLAKSNELISEVRGVCAECDVVICCLGLDAAWKVKKATRKPVCQRRQAVSFSAGKPGACTKSLHRERKTCGGGGAERQVRWPWALRQGRGSRRSAGMVPRCPGRPGRSACFVRGMQSAGKLPVTFYHSDEDLPAFTDYAMKGRTYRYMEKEPLYPLRLWAFLTVILPSGMPRPMLHRLGRTVWNSKGNGSQRRAVPRP